MNTFPDVGHQTTAKVSAVSEGGEGGVLGELFVIIIFAIKILYSLKKPGKDTRGRYKLYR